jgi:hypothetical protein
VNEVKSGVLLVLLACEARPIQSRDTVDRGVIEPVSVEIKSTVSECVEFKPLGAAPLEDPFWNTSHWILGVEMKKLRSLTECGCHSEGMMYEIDQVVIEPGSDTEHLFDHVESPVLAESVDRTRAAFYVQGNVTGRYRIAVSCTPS